MKIVQKMEKLGSILKAVTLALAVLVVLSGSAVQAAVETDPASTSQPVTSGGNTTTSTTTTTGTCASSQVHGPGTNIVQNGTVYVINFQCQKQVYPTWAIFLSYPGNTQSNIKPANTEDIYLLNGPNIEPNDGAVVLDNKVVYLFKGGQKHAFSSPTVFFDLGYRDNMLIRASTSGIAEGVAVTSASQTQFASGPLNTTPTGGSYTYPVCNISTFYSDPAVITAGSSATINWQTYNCSKVVLITYKKDLLVAYTTTAFNYAILNRLSSAENLLLKSTLGLDFFGSGYAGFPFALTLPTPPNDFPFGFPAIPIPLGQAKEAAYPQNSGQQVVSNVTKDQPYLLLALDSNGRIMDAKDLTIGVSNCKFATLTSDKTSVQTGGTATISWTSNNCTSANDIYIYPGTKVSDFTRARIPQGGIKMTANGNYLTRALTTPTSFTMVAFGPSGWVDTKDITIGVDGVTAPTSPCEINGFTATPIANVGDKSILSWSITSGCTSTVNNIVNTTTGDNVTDSSGLLYPVTTVIGSVQTKALVGTTEYQLSVGTNIPGDTTVVTAKAKAILGSTTNPDPNAVCKINSFTVTPSTISLGGSATLNWNSTGCTSLSLNGGSIYNQPVAAIGNSGVFAAPGYQYTNFILTAQPGNVTSTAVLTTNTSTTGGNGGGGTGGGSTGPGTLANGISITKGVRNTTLGEQNFFSTTRASSGNEVDFQITFKNSSSTPAVVAFKDAMPTGLDFAKGSINFGVSFEPMFNANSNVQILVGAGVTYNLIYKATVSGTTGTLVNTATTTDPAYGTASSSASVILNTTTGGNTGGGSTGGGGTGGNTPTGSNGYSGPKTYSATGVNGAPNVTLTTSELTPETGDYLTLTWTSQNATGCYAGIGQRDLPMDDGWSGGVLYSWTRPLQPNGTMTVGPVFGGAQGTGPIQYWIGCEGSNKLLTTAVVAYVYTQVGPMPQISGNNPQQPVAYGSDAFKAALIPSLTLTPATQTISSGGSVTLNWSSQNVTACYASGGLAGNGWAPNGVAQKGTSGSQTIGPVSAVGGVITKINYILDCYGQYGQITVKTAKITVNP